MTAGQMPRATTLQRRPCAEIPEPCTTPRKRKQTNYAEFTPAKRPREESSFASRISQIGCAVAAKQNQLLKEQSTSPAKEASREPSASPGTKRATLCVSTPEKAPAPVPVKVTPGYEVVELQNLLEEHQVPASSRELLLPLLQHWGPVRMPQVLRLWSFLGTGSEGRKLCNLQRRCSTSLHVWGQRGTGKTGLVEDYLQRMRVPYVKLNALGFTNELEAHQQLVRGLTAVAVQHQRAAKSEIESLDPVNIPKHVRQLDRLEAALDLPLATLDRLGVAKVIIVLDRVEEAFRRVGKEGLELLMRLPQILPRRGSMLGLVTIGLGPSVGSLHPTTLGPNVCFPSYTERELEVLLPHLLIQKYPHCAASLGEANWVVVMTGLLQFALPYIGADLGLLLDVGSDVLEALMRESGSRNAAGTGASTGGRQHKKTPTLGEITEKINDLVTEACQEYVDLKPFAGQASNPVGRADAIVAQMTKAEMQVLLAAYLGSYVSQKDDRRLFLGVASRRKITVRKKKEEDNVPCWVKAPRTVPAWRLLVIYHKLAMARTNMLLGSHFWITLVSLKEAGLVRICNERGYRAEKDIKVVCLANMYIARACAVLLDIDLAEYLC